MELNKGIRIVSIDCYNLQGILFGLRIRDKYLHILKINGIINNQRKFLPIREKGNRVNQPQKERQPGVMCLFM